MKPASSNALLMFRAEAVFPGRTKLYVHEFAEAFAITTWHALSLIEEGRITAERVATHGPLQNRYRITPAAFDAFVAENASRTGDRVLRKGAL